MPRRARLCRDPVCSSLAIEARAQDASPWQRDGHSAVRLLAGSRSGAVLLGGIAFQLQPGWKTYWRTPGDSGVPPRFDFSKSENIEAVTVLWPAPTKFDDGAGGHSLGYHDQIVLPLRIVAKNADKPVTLRADINYAVCEKLCIPVEANAELAVHQRGEHRGQRAVRSARHRAEARQCRRSQPADHPRRQARRQIDRAGRRGRRPTPRTSTCLSKDRRRTGRCRFQNCSNTARPGSSASPSNSTACRRAPIPEGAALKLTLVGGDRSYEFNINLD